MFDNLKTYIKSGLSGGFNVPHAIDGENGKPSATLFFAYGAFVVALGAEIYFIIKGDPLASTCTAIMFWALAVIFYRIRKLDKVKIDLDDRSVELDNDSDEDKKP